MMNSGTAPPSELRLALFLALAVLTFAALYLLTLTCVFPGDATSPETAWQTRGLFGDTFGALNALFSGFAFAGVIYAIFLQRQDLRSQERRLDEQQKEIAAQTKTMKDATLHQVLSTVLLEYRSPEMFYAVRTLRRFYAANGADEQNLVAAYQQTRDAEAGHLNTLSPVEQLAALRGTFDHQRRLVSHFYGFLSGLYDLQIIPRTLLYTYWTRDDLDIIPKVIIPLDRQLEKDANVSASARAWFERLQKLYDDSPPD